MSTQAANEGRVTTQTLRQMKERGEKIASLTAYDAAFARVVDRAGCDFILVGDSVGMVVQGHATTIPVTIEDIIYHTLFVLQQKELMDEQLRIEICNGVGMERGICDAVILNLNKIYLRELLLQIYIQLKNLYLLQFRK